MSHSILRFFVLTLVLVTTALQAQIVEVPIIANPSLSNYSTLPLNSSTSFHGTFSNRDFVECLSEGKTMSFTLDTLDIGGGSLTIEKQGSTLIASFNGNILELTTPIGSSGKLDTVKIKICQSGDTTCSIQTIIYAISRNGISTTLPVIITSEEIQNPVLLPVIDLPFELGEIVIQKNNNDEQGIPYIKDGNTFVYAAGRGSFSGTYRVIACDIYCTCDTFFIPVVVQGAVLNLPFLDDFNTPGPYSDKTNWLDDRVYINNDYSMLPPTIGVATFDGLNQRGTNYGTGQGTSDILTSRAINVSNAGGTVWLSYWLEAGGLGNVPEAVDSFYVEFKNSLGSWLIVKDYAGNSIPTNRFTFDSIQLDPQFLHSNFQFRFRNLSGTNGIVDIWHLDYVHLEPGPPLSRFTTDVAFFAQPSGILKVNSAMPWWQFQGNEDKELRFNADSLKFDVSLSNLDLITLVCDPSTISIEEINKGSVILNNQTLLELPPIVSNDQRSIIPGHRTIRSTRVFAGLKSAFAASLVGSGPFNVQVDYAFEQTAEPTNSTLVIGNNKVRSNTILDNYFSKDDGTAESNIGVVKSGSEGAVKFHANKPDTLLAISFHFPRVANDITKQSMNLRVFIGNLDDTPDFTDFNVKPFYVDAITDTLQGFTTYVLTDQTGAPIKIPIPIGDFFVGWQQAVDINPPITVGFDKNSPNASSDYFVKTQNKWETLKESNLEGALMIRAYMGSIVPTNTPDTNQTNEESTTDIQVFPNPVVNIIEIQSNKDLKFVLMDLQGKIISHGNYYKPIDVSGLNNGLYLLQTITKEDLSPRVFKIAVIH